MIVEYSFCETVTASGSTPWHIRPLSATGRKLSGGADTDALCGRKVAWDVGVPLTVFHLSRCCWKCRRIFDERRTPPMGVG
jgi:hypothetical protein